MGDFGEVVTYGQIDELEICHEMKQYEWLELNGLRVQVDQHGGFRVSLQSDWSHALAVLPEVSNVVRIVVVPREALNGPDAGS